MGRDRQRPLLRNLNHRHKEIDVIEKRTSGGPGVGLLLFIPAALLVAKAAMHHHRMAWDETEGRDGLRLPPRAARMLDAWHTQAHQSAGTADAAPETDASA